MKIILQVNYFLFPRMYYSQRVLNHLHQARAVDIGKTTNKRKFVPGVTALQQQTPS